jgi:magnesium transporter
MKPFAGLYNEAGGFKFFKSRSHKTGLPPGSLAPVAESVQNYTKITAFAYSESECREFSVDSIDDIRETNTLLWINIDGLADISVIEAIGTRFGVHALLLEDVLDTDQRPKFEEYERYVFAILKMIFYEPGKESLHIEQVSFVAGNGFVVSIQEREGDVFAPVRERLRSSSGRIRRMGADYLLYALCDTIVDNFFGTLERFGEQIELLDARIVESPDDRAFKTIHDLRRDSLIMRRSIWPVREMASAFSRSESSLITEETRFFIRDIYDHAIIIADTLETYRDMLSGIRDVYLSSVSNRMNEIMKVLTIIATIFIPLSFIAGLYGMNFHHMPELKMTWGYPAALALMALVGGGMLLYFRKRKWI